MHRVYSDTVEVKDFCNYLWLFTSEANRTSSRVRFHFVMPWDHLLTTHPALLSAQRPALSLEMHSVSLALQAEELAIKTDDNYLPVVAPEAWGGVRYSRSSVILMLPNFHLKITYLCVTWGLRVCSIQPLLRYINPTELSPDNYLTVVTPEACGYVRYSSSFVILILPNCHLKIMNYGPCYQRGFTYRGA